MITIIIIIVSVAKLPLQVQENNLKERKFLHLYVSLETAVN